MLKFNDLSEEDQAHAVYQALAILMMDGDASTEAAQELAARAFYPEEDDPIIFLCPLLTDEDCADLEDEVLTILETDPVISAWPIALRNRMRNDQAA